VVSDSPFLTKVYLDAQFPYEIRFNDAWVFRRTHGTNTNGSPASVLSRIDLSRGSIDHPSAYVAVEVLNAAGLTSLEEWLKRFDRQMDYSKGQKFTFKGVPAVRFDLDSGNGIEKLYFLKGAYAFRLFAWEKGSLSPETLAIRDSFRP
jgi:hypothetical protein